MTPLVSRGSLKEKRSRPERKVGKGVEAGITAPQGGTQPTALVNEVESLLEAQCVTLN